MDSQHPLDEDGGLFLITALAEGGAVDAVGYLSNRLDALAAAFRVHSRSRSGTEDQEDADRFFRAALVTLAAAVRA
jgi:hypothetical protein